MPAPTVEDFKRFLRKSRAEPQEEADLERDLLAGVQWVEHRAGPFAVRVFTRQLLTAGGLVPLAPRPVTVTAVTTEQGAPRAVRWVDPQAWLARVEAGRYGWWTVTGTHGWDDPPAAMTEAALVVAGVHWRQRMGDRQARVDEPRAGIPHATRLLADYAAPAVA